MFFFFFHLKVMNNCWKQNVRRNLDLCLNHTNGDSILQIQDSSNTIWYTLTIYISYRIVYYLFILIRSENRNKYFQKINFCSQRCVLLSCDWYLIVYQFISHGSLHIACRSFINLYNLSVQYIAYSHMLYNSMISYLLSYTKPEIILHIFITTCRAAQRRVLD